MPVDFYSNSTYDFPYKLLIDIIKSKFESNENLIIYLDEWYNILHFTQKFQNEDYRILRAKHDSLKAENKGFELFVFDQSFPEVENNHLIHFDINKIISDKRCKARLIRTKQLINNVNYNQDEQCHKFPYFSPIIIAPYILLNNNYIVIDGNKRLVTNIKYNIPFTRYTMYYPMDVKDFGFAIDWAFYWFFLDVNSHFSNQILKCEWFQEQIKELHSKFTEY